MLSHGNIPRERLSDATKGPLTWQAELCRPLAHRSFDLYLKLYKSKGRERGANCRVHAFLKILSGFRQAG
jgi:hypothetical protein